MNSIPKARTKHVVLQPATCRALQRGIHKIVAAIRPTLGPRPRLVAIDRTLDDRMPELVDNGGVIARHIVQLPDRDEDMGAMLVRDVLRELHDQVGDGTATAAVLFQSIYDQGIRYLASGGNAVRLRFYLEKGARAIHDHLTSMTFSVTGKEKLAQVAQTICYDPPLSRMLGEIFDIVGEYGRVEIRAGRNRGLEREYVEGMYWESGLFAREMITDHSQQRREIENAAILISDVEVESLHQLLPALDLALKTKIPALMIVAGKLSADAVALLLTNTKSEAFQAIAVKTPGGAKDILEDLAVLTGGRPFVKAAGDTLSQIRLEDFGYARRVWADHHNFGIVGGKGDPRILRRHIGALRAVFNETKDFALRHKLQKRIGQLLGGSATLWIGGETELEITTRKELAERTAAAMRGTIMEGVLPGGGAALLACCRVLQPMLDQSADTDERAAYRILLRAMEAPILAIVSNAGYDTCEVMAQIKLAGPAYGFDVTSGKVVGMMQAGIWDAAAVQKSAVNAAIAGAALALTVDVLVHRHEQPRRAPAKPPSRRKRL
jgi:chaperonin GroEL